MDVKKQRLLVEYLISSSDVFTICQKIVEPDYFAPELKNTIRFIKNYYLKYNATPDQVQIYAETGVELTKQTVRTDQVHYCTSEIENFCRRRALETAILSSVDLISAGDFETIEKRIREAILISLNKDLGLQYFENPETRLQTMLVEDPVEPTGWEQVDKLLFGGIGRKELLLVAANSGGGKSLTLANLGFNFLKRKRNVLYISLELSEQIVAQRFDTMFTGISRRDWKQHTTEITTKLAAAKREFGTLNIIQMPSGTRANDIQSYLKEYQLHFNCLPDLLILDYLDKMNPNERHIDLSDVWTKDKLCSEQLRDIGVKHNMVIASASQLNRSAVGATHQDHSQIAGGISKINEADVYWSISFNEALRAQGQIAFHMQKTRNSDGVNQTVFLKWDNTHLRILDEGKDSTDKLRLKTKKSKFTLEPTAGNLFDLMPED